MYIKFMVNVAVNVAAHNVSNAGFQVFKGDQHNVWTKICKTGFLNHTFTCRLMWRV